MHLTLNEHDDDVEDDDISLINLMRATTSWWNQ